MTRYPTLAISLLAIMLMTVLFVLPEGSDGSSSSDLALIVVSDYGGTDQFELDKALDLYNYLLDDGFSADNILFLADDSATGIDDVPDLDNIEDGFDWLKENADCNTDVIIYISDNLHGTQSDPYFRFSDGNLYASKIEDWVDDITFDELTFIGTGPHSGLFGKDLKDTDRTIMASMKANEDATPDEFDIVRGLNDPSADTNNDGMVSFEEAFYKESSTVTGQTPQIWI